MVALGVTVGVDVGVAVAVAVGVAVAVEAAVAVAVAVAEQFQQPSCWSKSETNQQCRRGSVRTKVGCRIRVRSI